jgi:DNA-binding GntR family transcriptional regulator
MEVRRDCMSAQIRKALVKRIVEGYYKPGDRLLEMQIAGEFQTSQGPVREALRELEALRLVESQAFRGTRVRLLTEREMREAGQVRGMLEEMAAREAAAVLKGNVGPIRDEFEAIHEASRTQDLDGYAAHNMAFHRLIVEAGGNEVLLRVWDSLMLEVRTRIGLSQFHLDLVEVAESHRPILEALERGDGEEAGRMLRKHAETLCFWEQQGAAAMAAGARAENGRPAPLAS